MFSELIELEGGLPMNIYEFEFITIFCDDGVHFAGDIFIGLR